MSLPNRLKGDGMNVSYFNVQRFCLQDGPGIRTTLFLKGCPLRCLWCHNPEGRDVGKKLLFRADRCTGCGRCVGLCKARRIEGGKAAVDRSLCTACGRCVEPCLSDCSEICGKETDTGELFDILVKDRLYFEESGGGVTVSGGEPLMQKEALLDLARRAKEAGVSFAVETCGYGDTEALLDLSRLGCLFLYDVKGIDDEKHAVNTGVSNRRILSNLDALFSAGADVIVRMPLVPGYNDSERDLELLAGFLGSIRDKILRAEIMPYHRIGLGKASSLGIDVGEMGKVPDGKEFADRWLGALSPSGVEIKVN